MTETNPAIQSRNYGHKIEVAVRDQYDLDLDQNEWHDALTTDGEPVEIKSAKRIMNNGRVGRVLIRRSAHRQLQDADGWYLFAVYRGRGQGVEILETTMRRARAVRIDSWQTIDGGRREKQIEITDVI